MSALQQALRIMHAELKKDRPGSATREMKQQAQLQMLEAMQQTLPALVASLDDTVAAASAEPEAPELGPPLSALCTLVIPRAEVSGVLAHMVSGKPVSVVLQGATASSVSVSRAQDGAEVGIVVECETARVSVGGDDDGSI